MQKPAKTQKEMLALAKQIDFGSDSEDDDDDEDDEDDNWISENLNIELLEVYLFV